MKSNNKVIRVNISEPALEKYKIGDRPEIDFDELVEKISLEKARQALLECNSIAEETGLSEMTPEEIDAEVTAVRNAKNNS